MSLVFTPDYLAWMPVDHCGEYPGFCPEDMYPFRSDEGGLIFPHVPFLARIPVGEGQVYYFNHPFPVDVLVPGQAGETIRANLISTAAAEARNALDWTGTAWTLY